MLFKIILDSRHVHAQIGESRLCELCKFSDRLTDISVKTRVRFVNIRGRQYNKKLLYNYDLPLKFRHMKEDQILDNCEICLDNNAKLLPSLSSLKQCNDNINKGYYDNDCIDKRYIRKFHDMFMK